MMNPLTSMFKSFLSLAVIMRFEQLNEGVWAMTYLIVDEATNEAALVDPVYDFMQQYICLLYTSPSPRDS